MEPIRTDFGFGELPAKRPEKPKEEDTKDKKKSDHRTPLVPIFRDTEKEHGDKHAFQFVKSETDANKDRKFLSLGDAAPHGTNEDEVLFKAAIEKKDKELRPDINPATAVDVSRPVPDAAPEQSVSHIPSAEETWARISREQSQVGTNRQEAAKEIELHRSDEAFDGKLAAEAAILSLEPDDVIHDLPLEASRIHERLQFEPAAKEPEPEAPQALPEPPVEHTAPERPTAPNADTAETQQQPTPSAAEVGNGGSPQPPHPPHGPEYHAANGDEPPPPPEMPPQHWPSPEQRTPMVNPLRVDQLTAAHAVRHETQIVERGDGAALALLFGIGNWLGNRRTRRELRRGQKRQNKQIRDLQRRQKQTTTAHQQQLTEQRSLNERLRSRLDQLANRSNHHFQSEHQTINLQQMLANEQRRRQSSPEGAPLATRPEAVPARLASSNAERAAIEQQPHLPRDHHLERSAWHNIEVDKTGRAVEQPIFVYGQEFKREQHQEAWRDTARSTATGQLILQAASTAATNPLQPGQTLSSSKSLPRPSSRAEQTIRERSRPRVSLVAAVERPWVLVLVVVVLFIVISLVIVR